MPRKKNYKSPIDVKLDALPAKKIVARARKGEASTESAKATRPWSVERGTSKYGRHAAFEGSIAAIETTIDKLVTDLDRARRKRRSLLAAARARLRYEQSKEYRSAKKAQVRESYRDRFDTNDDFKY